MTDYVNLVARIKELQATLTPGRWDGFEIETELVPDGDEFLARTKFSTTVAGETQVLKNGDMMYLLDAHNDFIPRLLEAVEELSTNTPTAPIVENDLELH